MESDDPQKSKHLANLAFSTAFRERSDPTAEPRSNLPDTAIDDLISRFEGAAQVDGSGIEYWYARDLQELLGYLEYRNFQPVIQRAMEACRNSRQPAENHFVQVHEMVEIGSGRHNAGEFAFRRDHREGSPTSQEDSYSRTRTRPEFRS